MLVLVLVRFGSGGNLNAVGGESFPENKAGASKAPGYRGSTTMSSQHHSIAPEKIIGSAAAGAGVISPYMQNNRLFGIGQSVQQDSDSDSSNDGTIGGAQLYDATPGSLFEQVLMPLAAHGTPRDINTNSTNSIPADRDDNTSSSTATASKAKRQALIMPRTPALSARLLQLPQQAPVVALVTQQQQQQQHHQQLKE